MNGEVTEAEDGRWLIYRLPQIPSGQPVAPIAESFFNIEKGTEKIPLIINSFDCQSPNGL